MRKMVSVVLVCALLLSCIGPIGVSAATANNLVTTDGFLVVEAENLAFDESVYKLISGDADVMSGGAAIGMNTTTPEDKDEQAIDAPAHIDLSFEADASASYTIWMRNTANQTGSSANSIWLSIGDGAYSYTVLDGAPTEYAWSRIGSVVVSAGSEASVRIRRRQRGSAITLDKFIITSDPLYIPRGISGENTEEFSLPDGEYEMPKVTPPAEHPRLLFRESDLAEIITNMSNPKHETAYNHWRKMVAKTHSGNFSENTGTGNYNTATIHIAEAKAFDYVINNNAESGQAALSMAENMLNTADFTGYSFEVRAYGHLISTVARIYDWCYPLIENDETRKKNIIHKCEIFATKLSIGYPPRRMGSITGHSSESMLLIDLLSLGIATYNERPDIYNFVAGRLYQEYVQPRQYWNQSHSYHQGSGYVGARFYWDIVANFIMSRMTGNDEVFITDSSLNPTYGDSYENMHKVFYESLYRMRPDGQAFRLGDDYNEYGHNKGEYWSCYNHLFFYGANYFGDPYLLDRSLTSRANANTSYGNLSFSDGAAGQGTYSSLIYLIANDPNLEPRSTSELDKTMYFPSPNGMMIARTGWETNVADPSASNDVMALMKIGELNAANHNHRDSGSFQLYYKGILASESGFYGDYGDDHDSKYHKTSIAHNTIAVHTGKIAGGGQRPNAGEPSNFTIWMTDSYKTGRVLAHEYGPDAHSPEYSYIKGDIADAYSTGVEEVTRSMLFMPLENENYPAAMIVFDKVTSSDASYKKSWLLHMQEQPAVNGDRITVTRTQDGYNGKMSVQTLLPESTEVDVIGGEGHEFEVDGVNYPIAETVKSTWARESGWGRVEISPAENNLTDYFLNVMTVSDADSTASEIESELFENTTHYGAAFLDRLCLFAKDSTVKSNELEIAVPSTGSKKVFVEGMEAGKYVITDTLGVSLIQASVSEEGGVLYFDAVGGRTYNIEKADFKIADVTEYSDEEGLITLEANIAGNDTSGIVIFAVYDRYGALMDISKQDYHGTCKYSTSFSTGEWDADTEIKVFLWDSVSKMLPLAKSYRFKPGLI